MDKPISEKKKSWALSLTSRESEAIEDKARSHGFKDRNAYVLALHAADIDLGLEVALHPDTKERILQISSEGMERLLIKAQQRGVIDDPETRKYLALLTAAMARGKGQKKVLTVIEKGHRSKTG